MGYEGKHDEHLAPIIDLLDSLKDKLRKAVTVSENDVAEKKKKRDEIRSEADKVGAGARATQWRVCSVMCAM
jgi:prefoldin subunit 5